MRSFSFVIKQKDFYVISPQTVYARVYFLRRFCFAVTRRFCACAATVIHKRVEAKYSIARIFAGGYANIFRSKPYVFDSLIAILPGRHPPNLSMISHLVNFAKAKSRRFQFPISHAITSATRCAMRSISSESSPSTITRR